MTDVKEVSLPGVGVRYEFTTAGGDRVGVVCHRTGKREIFRVDPKDPDAFRPVMALGPDDSRTLGELLGVSHVTEQLAQLQQKVEGLAIDWLPLDADSPYAGRTIGDARVRTRTGVSIVAIVRGEDAVPAPEPDQRLEAGDYLVVVGTPQGIEQTVALLHQG